MTSRLNQPTIIHLRRKLRSRRYGVVFLGLTTVGLTLFAGSPAALSATSSPTPSSNVLLSDSFESGTVAFWTKATNTIAQNNVVDRGLYSALATSTSTKGPAFLSKTLAASAFDITATSRLDVVSQSSSFSLLRLRAADDKGIVSLFRRTNGQLAAYNEVTGTTTVSKTVMPTNSWHSVTVQLQIGPNGGTLQVWLDNASVDDLATTSRFGTTGIGRVLLGDPGSGRTFSVAYDNAVAWSPDASTPTPTLTPTTTTTAATPVTTTTTTTTPGPITTTTPLLPAASGGNVYVVSPTGSNAGTGSVDNPWRTVSKALSSAAPGDAVYLRGGIYLERVNPVLQAGTATAPISVSEYPGERPVLQGVLWLHSPSYWRIHGINVTWDSATGLPNEQMVKLIGGVGWTYSNAEIWGARSYAALLVTADSAGILANWTVSGNCIHDTYPTNNTNQDHLIYANTGLGAGAGRITGNLLFNVTNGEGIKLGGSDVHVGAAVNVTADHNTIYNAIQPVLIAWDSDGNTLDHNILMKASGNYGGIRGYQLVSSSNQASNNIGYSLAKMFLNDPGYAAVADSGGNILPVDPQFDSTASCAGFNAANPAASGYGA